MRHNARLNINVPKRDMHRTDRRRLEGLERYIAREVESEIGLQGGLGFLKTEIKERTLK